MCDHQKDQNLLSGMLLFLCFLPHLRSHLKYECHPEVTQMILAHSGGAAVQGLTLKDRWQQGSPSYLVLAKAQLLTFLSTDDKRLSL